MQSKAYDNTPLNFAQIDNLIAAGQLAIGESSNLAQTALTYGYSFGEKKYDKYISVLSVLAQVAIDSAKRLFDIDITAEIARIKAELNVKENGYPAYWKIIATNTKKRKELNGGHIDEKINYALHCPMNHVYRMTAGKYMPDTPTLPIKNFYKQYTLDMHRDVSRRIEKLITKYSLDLMEYTLDESDDDETYLLLREDFDELIVDIREAVIPSKYVGLFSWLINRAFVITPGAKQNKGALKTTISKNKPLLLKVLYDANPEALLKCFSAKIPTPSDFDRDK